MTDRRLSVVDGSLSDYPFAAEERLTSHYFLAWHFDRWLNSRFRLCAPPAVRGIAFDLYCVAQRQSPVGTLPDDDDQLARLALVDLATWKGLRAAGCWLETDDETGKPLWRVWCEITPIVDVAAYTAKEARRLAREKAEEEFAHVDDVTISSVCRATSK